MPQQKEFFFPSCDKKNQIYVRQWIPEGEVRGVVQVAHGVAEHVARYDTFMAFLAENGFAAAGNDHLGHGKSAASTEDLGFFGENGGWEKVVGDMHQLHEHLAEEYPGIPQFLLGHSMGSFLARTYIIRYRSGLQGVILSGTGHQRPALTRAGAAMAQLEIHRHGPDYKSQRLNDLAFGKYNDAFAPARTINDWISRDTEVVDAYTDDPFCGYIPSAGLFAEMMQGLQYITAHRNIARMKKDLPIFFVSGDADPVGEMGKGVIRAYQAFLKAGMTDVTLKLYHEGRHEMLNELNRSEVYADILNWLVSKLPK